MPKLVGQISSSSLKFYLSFPSSHLCSFLLSSLHLFPSFSSSVSCSSPLFIIIIISVHRHHLLYSSFSSSIFSIHFHLFSLFIFIYFLSSCPSSIFISSLPILSPSVSSSPSLPPSLPQPFRRCPKLCPTVGDHHCGGQLETPSCASSQPNKGLQKLPIKGITECMATPSWKSRGLSLPSGFVPALPPCCCRTPAAMELGQNLCVGRCWDLIFLALGAGSGLLASSIGCRMRRRAFMNLPMDKREHGNKRGLLHQQRLQTRSEQTSELQYSNNTLGKQLRGSKSCLGFFFNLPVVIALDGFFSYWVRRMLHIGFARRGHWDLANQCWHQSQPSLSPRNSRATKPQNVLSWKDSPGSATGHPKNQP